MNINNFRTLTHDRSLISNWPSLSVYLGLVSLVCALPTSHTNTLESIGVILILIGYLAQKLIKKDWRFSDNPLFIPLAIMFIVILSSVSSAYRLDYTVNEIRGEFLTYTMLFFAISDFCQDQRRLRRVLTIFLLGNIFAILFFSYKFYLLDFNQNKFVPLIGTSGMAFSNGLTETSSYFLIFSTLYYTALFFVKSKKWLTLVFLLLAINSYLLILSNQRAGVVAMVVAVFVPLLFIRRIIPGRKYIILFVLVGFCLVVFFSPVKSRFIHGHWQKVFTGKISELNEHDNIEVRVLLIAHFWQEFKKHPFTGYGYGRSNLKKIDTESVKPRPGLYSHAHNYFINFALQTGLQGLFVLLFLLFVKLKIFFKGLSFSEIKEEQMIFAGAICLIFSFWTRMMFDDVYHSETALAYWLVMAMAVAVFMGKKNEISSEG